MFVKTGEYMEHRSDTPLRSVYYTFTPRTLTGGDFYVMNDEIASLLTTAHRSIGILEGMFLNINDNETFAELLLLKESCFNKMIDCPDFNKNTFLLNHGLGNTDSDIVNIASGYRDIYKVQSSKMSCDDIARCVSNGSNSKQKVSFRSVQIFLSKSISNYRQYNPTAPKDIYSAMSDIDRYAENDGIDVLIKSAMCHYQFEMIHPYERYNGIVGRLFVYKMLHDAGLLSTRYLSVSESLYNHRAEYFEKLGLTQENGSYAAWIGFFINIINEAAQNGITAVQAYMNTVRSEKEKLASDKRSLRYLDDVYNYYMENIVSSINRTSNQLQLTYSTVSRAIEELRNLGILTQINEQSRNRLFSHTGLMRLFLSE